MKMTHAILLVVHASLSVLWAQTPASVETLGSQNVVATGGAGYQALAHRITLSVNKNWQSSQRYGKIDAKPLLFSAMQLDSGTVVEQDIAAFTTTRTDGTPVTGLLSCNRRPYDLQNDDWEFNWSPNLVYDGSPSAPGRQEYQGNLTEAALHRFIDESRFFHQAFRSDKWLCLRIFQVPWHESTGKQPSITELNAIKGRQQREP